MENCPTNLYKGPVTKHYLIGTQLQGNKKVGRFVKVFLGWHKLTNSMAAIRIKKLENAKSCKTATEKSNLHHSEKLALELAKLSKLRHDRILRYKFITIVNDNNLVALVTNVCLTSLSSLLPLSSSECSFVSRGIVEGLVYLHHKDVVHGALSPNNVLLDDRGNIRLSDFGLHCLSSPREQYGKWLPPEFESGSELMNVTQASDIWCLGVTIVQCHMGQLPYRHFRLKSPLEKVADSPVHLREFVSLCLNKDPAQRPTSAQLNETDYIASSHDRLNSEAGLELLNRIVIRPEIKDADVKDAKDRLDCSECGMDTGYSIVFRNHEDERFSCDRCLEKSVDHMDCNVSVGQCVQCSKIKKILQERWRRQASLDALLFFADSDKPVLQNVNAASFSDDAKVIEEFNNNISTEKLPTKPLDEANVTAENCETLEELKMVSIEAIIKASVNDMKNNNGTKVDDIEQQLMEEDYDWEKDKKESSQHSDQLKCAFCNQRSFIECGQMSLNDDFFCNKCIEEESCVF